jgi:ABC-type uncharacterized transport system auxiliary subunit
MKLTLLPPFLGVALLLALSGCLSRSSPRVQEFVLSPPASPDPPPAASTNVLSLLGVRVSPLFEGQRLVYRTGDNSYERDPYAVFLIPPQRMLEECLRASLRNCGAFSQVTDPGSALPASHKAEISVSELYGDFRDLNQPAAVLKLRFRLFRARTGRPDELLWEHEFTARVPFAKRVPAALVAAWNDGLRQILAQIKAHLERLP